ncbi:PMD domain-containing protein [Citrus sinensis]|uniref:PMD domain-containing protein n=1 Tax=Citrus sinensis TaxID=2711 RepID=A0ACB8P163_CITSI|nr:PMD domain-containing protein [Citrus sinensis]
MKVRGSHKRKAGDFESSCEMLVDAHRSRGSKDRENNHGFISFFAESVRQLKAKDGRACITNEVRKEIRNAFKNLPVEEKCQYKFQSRRGGKANVEKVKFLTRCAPDRLAALVSHLIEKQRKAVCDIGLGSIIDLKCGRLKRKLCAWLVERIDTARCVLQLNGHELELSPNSFGYIMGVTDGGMPMELQGDSAEVAAYLDKFNATSRGINIKTMEDILLTSKDADNDFKVAFMLFTLCTLLCPPGGVHISYSFLFTLKDVHSIRNRNWATFCFERLMRGITRYKDEKLAHILYINSVVYGKVRRDRLMCPLTLWNGSEIKRFMKWIEKKGGYGSKQVSVRVPSYGDSRACLEGAIEPCDEESDQTGYSKAIFMPSTVDDLVVDVGDLMRMTQRVVSRVWRLKSRLPCRENNGAHENAMEFDNMDEVSSRQLLHKGTTEDEEDIMSVIEKSNKLLLQGDVIEDDMETKLFEMHECGNEKEVRGRHSNSCCFGTSNKVVLE